MKLLDLNNYEKIILDCDGIIFDTNFSKISIFLKSVEQFSDKNKSLFKNFLNKNFGRSREYMFKYFLLEIVKQDQTCLPALLDKYSRECINMYNKKPFTEGFEKLINKFIEIPKIILSGSNQKELEEVFIQKKYYNFFEQILGSPRSKEEHLKKILKSSSEKIIFIGDSSYDFKVAKQFNIDFVFVSKYSAEANKKKFKNKIFTLEELL